MNQPEGIVNAKVEVQQHAEPFFSWDPCVLIISLDAGREVQS